MSPHRTPTRHPRPGRHPFATLRAFAAAVGVGAAGPAAAADPPPAPAESVRVSDVVLARAALAALDADPELRGATVVVSVVDRVAVLGGPVGTARQARRAEEVVRGVPGVADVRNTCFVAAAPDPLLRAVAGRMSTLPPRPVMFDLPGVLTGVMPPAPAPPVAVAGAVPGGHQALRPAGVPDLLGAPVGPAAPRPGDPGPGATPGVLTAAGAGVPAGVNEVRGSDPRFARLTVEARDGALVIGGSAPLASDAWDLARRLRDVPGVARVVVGPVIGK